MSNGAQPPPSPSRWTAAKNSPAPDAPVQIKQFPYLTRAVLEVNGSLYWEWESVQVRHAIQETPAYTARFTCSEMEPAYPAARWAFRIKPGDHCSIYLDGYLALSGFVVTRQAFYDANQHTVEIQAVAGSATLNAGSAVHETGEFKNMKPDAIIRELAKPFGVNVQVLGQGGLGQALDRFHLRPGETGWQGIERLARAGGMFLTSNENGDVVLMDSPIGANDTVTEGVNILDGREIIHSLAASGNYTAQNQGTGSDDLSKIAEWTHQRFSDQAGSTNFSPGYMPQVILSEMPAFAKGMMKTRAQLESNVNDMYQIWVTVSVLGWQRTSAGGLWIRGQNVHVNSPMLIMDRDLVLKAVTFSQDNSQGTRSTLELVNQAAMGGYADAGGGGGGGGGDSSDLAAG